MSVKAQRNAASSLFIVFISFLLSSIIHLLSAPRLKLLPCGSGTYRVLEAHREVKAAQQPWARTWYLP